MATIAILRGQARTVRPLRKRAIDGVPGDIFGHEVSVLTEAGTTYGETQRVTLFLNDDTDVPTPGSWLSWAVEFTANKYGLQAVFREDLSVLAQNAPTAA